MADSFQPHNCIAADLEAHTSLRAGHGRLHTQKHIQRTGSSAIASSRAPPNIPCYIHPRRLLQPDLLSRKCSGHILPRAQSTPAPTLSVLSGLTPLQGHVSAIHASMFFHLSDEAKQVELAQRLASLLSPTSGSLIFGRQLTAPIKGTRYAVASDQPVVRLFCHTPAWWAAL